MPLAQKFSTRVTGMYGSFNAMLSGMALLPRLTSSKQMASQAAPTSSRVIPSRAQVSDPTMAARSSLSESARPSRSENPLLRRNARSGSTPLTSPCLRSP